LLLGVSGDQRVVLILCEVFERETVLQVRGLDLDDAIALDESGKSIT
jgi:hypothetical protein